MKYLKKLLTEENKTKVIGLLTILALLWIVLYLIPGFLPAGQKKVPLNSGRQDYIFHQKHIPQAR